MYEDLAKALKRNTEIIHDTFNKYNLQVQQVAYRPNGLADEDDPDADCEFYIELSTLDDGPMKDNAYYKINLYDENGDLLYHHEHFIYAKDFDGYDTYSVMIVNDCKTLLIAKSAKVYMSRNY